MQLFSVQSRNLSRNKRTVRYIFTRNYSLVRGFVLYIHVMHKIINNDQGLPFFIFRRKRNKLQKLKKNSM